MTKLTEEELKMVREIRIHKILGLDDTGRRVSMPCPIHVGKNPNFNVYPDNSFHCFKCGANGHGAIDFCQELGFRFMDAVEELVKYIK